MGEDLKHVSLLLSIMFVPFCLAQMSPPDDITHDNPIPPIPDPLQLPSILGSGNNFTAYIPYGGVKLRLRNQGEFSSSILMMAISADGDRQTRIVELAPGESQVIEAGFFRSDGPVHLISLQDFEATALTAVVIAGRETANVPVRAPRSRLRLAQVETSLGVRTMGVDWDGFVHFPVFNPERPFGVWSEEDEAVIAKDGVSLPSFEEK